MKQFLSPDGLITRRKIIEIWKKQSNDILDSFCCPNCRDILSKEGEEYYCENCSSKKDTLTRAEDKIALFQDFLRKWDNKVNDWPGWVDSLQELEKELRTITDK